MRRRRGDGITKPPPGSRLILGHPLARGLVGSWDALENSGSATRDLVSGTMCPLNGATWRGQGILCDATTEYIGCGNAAALNPGELTFTMKFRRQAWTTHATLAAHRSSASVGHFFLFANATALPTYALCFDDYMGNLEHRWNSEFVPPLNEWAIVAVTWDRVTKKLYVGGRLINAAAGAVSGNLAVSAVALTLGKNSYSNLHTLNGEIEYARMYSRAILPDEVAQLAAQPYCMIDY